MRRAQTDIDDTPKRPNGTAGAKVALVRIEPSTGWVSLNLRELVVYRELLFFLVWRDVKVRYKQTVLGASWAILQPFLAMVIFSIFFGGVAKIPSDGVPYPIFSYTAMVPWMFFANGLATASNSLVGGANLVKKVYFPRLIMPTAAVLSGVVDFALAFSMLVLMMLYFAIYPTPKILLLPFFLLLALITALGMSFWLAAMNVQFRDVRYVVPFMVQIWFFLTPIVYPSSMLPEPWHTLYGINPMAGVVEGFRWALLDVTTAPGLIIVISTLAAVFFMVSGAFYFRRLEKTFADVI